MSDKPSTYMLENPFYFPGMSYDDYDAVVRALANRDDNIISKVMHGEVSIKPRNERTREYIFKFLGIS